ncbi:DNA-binding protein [Opitutaceae bacterium EW11]|nr:DNA-binding protein [Opitutaceae bacterium EW11]
MPPAFRRLVFGLVLALGACAAVSNAGQGGDRLEAAFRTPPPEAKPWVFWYWMNASSSRAGITADLEAMKAVGIGGAHLVPIHGAAKPSLFEPTAEQFSPLWWDHVAFAVREAERLGLKIALHASDGYATAGGPWVTPETSMQKVVWTKTLVGGGQRLDLQLSQPETNEGYYEDISVVAVPAWEGQSLAANQGPSVTTDRPGPAPQFLAEKTDRVFTLDQAGWVLHTFPEPFVCRSITLRVPPTKGVQNATYQANRLLVEASEDGEHFRQIAQLKPPRHGWQDGDGDTTHAIPETKARYFRFRYNPGREEAGAEDIDSAKWKTVLKLRGIELSSEPRIDDFEGKSGLSWRISPWTTPEQLPDRFCVPLRRIVDLTGKMTRSGKLDWDAPAGRWIVLRLGHTSTGYRNDTGGAMKGLECDKFDAAAARQVFDHWFQAIVRHVGPELAGKAVKVLHVDSWECGSQNWSPVFRSEFRRRRGYDPLPFLPAMAGVPVESVETTERFLRDVRETGSDLIRENFFATLRELARANGCTFSAESVAPVGVVDNLAMFSAVDTPMGEFWLRSPTHDKPNDVLDAVSGAHVYGHPIVQAEAFTELQNQWDESPALLKPLGDRNLALGVNRFVYHVFAHNPWTDRRPGMTLGGVGHFFQRDQTWWKPGAAWIRYTERCQALLQQGTPVADVAVFTGEFAPRRALPPWRLAATFPGILPGNDARLDKRLLDAADWTDPLGGYSCDSINADALLRLAEVKDGRVVLPGGASYALLVVPARNALMPEANLLTAETLLKVERLVEQGATVLLAERPRFLRSNSERDADDAVARAHLTTLWPEDVRGAGERRLGRGRILYGPYTSDSFEKIGIARDVALSGPPESRPEGLAWTHRTLPDAEFYFVSNQRSVWRDVSLSFRTAGRVPELWDPVTGAIRTVQRWRSENGRTRLPVRLAPNGSVFVVFRHATSESGGAAGANWVETRALETLDGPWNVSFSPEVGGPAGVWEFSNLVSWTERKEPGIRNYSGTAIYTRSFRWSPGAVGGARVWLDLGEVRDLAAVAINGVPCGVAWTAPYRVEVTSALRPGINNLRIEVTNTWFNRLAGDSGLPAEQRVTFTTAPDRTKGKPLLAAGLLGPVTIQVEQ